MEFVDTHSHLFSEEFDSDRESTIKRALDSKVKTILLPNIDLESIVALKEFAALSPQHCLPMMGLHPCSVAANYKEQLQIIEAELFSDFKYFGVGEIGIDLHWDKTYSEEQTLAFIQQCNWAVDLRLGVSIHTRSATYEAIAALKTMEQKPKGVFHCFSGSAEEATEILKLGFKLGIGGVITYKNSSLPEILKGFRIEDIVLETDSPYLPPVPYRGKRNESAYIPFIAEKLSDVFGISVEAVADVTTRNAREVFGF
jgi:TatD DNase family protein